MLCFILFIGFFSDVHLNADMKHDTLSVRCGTASAAVACNGDILVPVLVPLSMNLCRLIIAERM